MIAPEPRCLSLEEVSQIVQNASEPYKTLFRFAAETGMRAGEICALQWDDVNLDERQIAVRRSVWKENVTTPKTRSGRRVICISDELTKKLRQIPHRAENVFLSKMGRPLDPEKVVQRHLRPLIERLGLPAAGLHAFRHFNATLMDAESVPMKTRQMRLGHSSPQTTLALYTHLLSDEDRRTAINLGRRITLKSLSKADQAQAASFWWSSTIFLLSRT